MRIQTLKIYTLSELSEEAQQKAIENYRNYLNCHGDIAWQEEILESFKKVYETANIKLLDYSLGLNSYSYVKIDLDDSIYNLTGARALGWLENNFTSKLRLTRNAYLKNRKENFRYGYRIGKIKDCPFTGYCADDDFIETLIEELKKGTCLGDVFKYRIPEKYIELLQGEYNDSISEERIRETLEINGYEFLENGETY